MSELVIRAMTREEAVELVSWAADEGWNPGLHDADVFWHTDPEGFIAAELEGQLIGGGAITSYDDRFGFMGLFIVKPELRGHGHGTTLWHQRKSRLQERLRPGTSIGMDGVFEMQPWYARGGFVFSHREIRFESTGAVAPDNPRIVPLTTLDVATVLAYDAECFPAPRERFLRAWVGQPDSLALAAVDGSRLNGYGVIRRCVRGAKVGPLFADDGESAESLYTSLIAFCPGESILIDVPENNPTAMALAARHDMNEVFGCARMYLGPAPRIRDERIFGVTTFELG